MGKAIIHEGWSKVMWWVAGANRWIITEWCYCEGGGHGGACNNEQVPGPKEDIESNCEWAVNVAINTNDDSEGGDEEKSVQRPTNKQTRML